MSRLKSEIAQLKTENKRLDEIERKHNVILSNFDAAWSSFSCSRPTPATPSTPVQPSESSSPSC